MARAAKSSEVLTERRLNRATLARQMLLAREKTTTERAVERLAGMQAQVARPPFVGLWTRLEKFRRDDLLDAIRTRAVVRGTLMRATLHLVTARDYLRMRPALQPGLTRGMKAVLGARTDGLDLDALTAAARKLLAERPLTFEELRDQLAKRDPKADLRAMAYAVRLLLPLVQVPTDDAPWGFPAAAAFTGAESWIGEPIAPDPRPHELILRYLAAYGPATPADMQSWSGLQGLRPVFEGLRPRLVTFADPRGRELFDLPRAPRPPEDTPAPVRFLPEYDNLVLAFEDRGRLVDDEHRKRLCTANLTIPGSFLVDGRVAGLWKVERKKRAATLSLTPFATLPKTARAELTAEGERLLAFVEPDAESRDLRFA